MSREKIHIEILIGQGQSTLRGIAHKLDIKAHSTVNFHIEKLINDGMVFKDINGKLHGVGTLEYQDSIAFWKAKCEALENKIHKINRISDMMSKPMQNNHEKPT